MTTLTDTQVVTASGGLVELGFASKNANQTITNGAAAATVIGPVTFVSDGSPCVLDFYVPRVDSAASTDFYFLVEIDGAPPSGVSQGRIWNWTPTSAWNNPCSAQLRFTPTAGSHTATIKAVSVGANVTVTCASSNWTPAFLRVSKIVRATQWPAVTTGTIICTSTTRPASPFEGQEIYETDTKKKMTYNGSGWYAFNQVIARATSTSAYTSTGTHTSPQDVGLSASVSYGANRLFRVTLHERPYVPGGANTVMERLTDGTTVFALFPHGQNDLSTGFAPAKTNVFTFAGPSTSGTATWKMQAYGGLNTQWVLYYSGGDGNPRQFTIEDIGPA